VVIGSDLSNATVVIPNIRAGASVIHVIDAVLLPNPDMPSTNSSMNVTAAEGPATLLEAVAATPELSVLAQAAGAANLTGLLNDTETVWTVFAPRNEVRRGGQQAGWGQVEVVLVYRLQMGSCCMNQGGRSDSTNAAGTHAQVKGSVQS
jgi:hypothetical protein